MVPKISVITPSFNQGKFLEATLKSVLQQGYPNLEYIVIDGGSTDHSVDILKAYSNRLSYWVSEKDNGQSHAFNKGLQQATGEIIGWINSDDVYLHQSLFKAADFFQKNPGVDIVFSDYWYIDEEGRFLKRRKEIPFRRSVYVWTSGCYHANCAGFFRRRVFDINGGLDDALHFGMDYEFYLRAATNGMTFAHCHDEWGAYRLHSASKTVASTEKGLVETSNIASKFRPKNITDLEVWFRRQTFKGIRLLWKLFLGSYLPGLRRRMKLPV